MIHNKKYLTLIFLIFIGIGLTACETMEGAGRDIQNAGESVEEAAE